ncbi:ABC transporter ATP-binding protein [Absicoccus porci]|uniref:ABC transporter ATP-binding protein n=1 Tax=Absicoccus porci TaxID=2486576 RepID=A0A3N0I577_9FIRM|nr:ABC transporter ATP-binding protein [Absicoccus porci]RNM31746.1 ABC transporter ATP-binding protein [Absicoccus porci]
MNAFLKVEGLCKEYGNGDSLQQVLKEVSFSLNKSKFCVLLGPSGSGKSTLLNIIGGIDTADCGTIQIGNTVLETMDDKHLTQYRRKYVGYVFQMYHLIPNLTVTENIETGAYIADDPLDVRELIQILGLWDHRDKFPNQLSGGQQQRVSIGRAIVKNPSLLLCDEPTGALDYHTSKEILALIETINARYGNTILMVTHNEAICPMADHIVHLHDGQIRSDTVNHEKVTAAELEW